MLKPFLTDHLAIREWLATYCAIAREIVISPEGLVSVNGPVSFNTLAHDELTHFAVQFDVVDSFSCSACRKLTSLVGSPRIVNRSFFCSHCFELETLEGAPQFVGGYFSFSYCQKLKSLEGSPFHISGVLDCRDNPRPLSLSGFNVPNGRLRFTAVKKPEPEVVKRLLQLRVELITNQRTNWISIVNDYHKSGDLLTAIAQFETYYKVPFASIMEPPLLLVVPEL